MASMLGKRKKGSDADAVAEITKKAKEEKEQIRIMFFYMGQGDCALIACPDGKKVMIDCGSLKNFSADVMIRAQLVLRSKEWCSDNKLHALILTHPDKDHFNCVGPILGSCEYKSAFTFDKIDYPADYTTEGFSVDHVYFSYKYKDDKSPLQYYKAGIAGFDPASTIIYNDLNVQTLNLVTIDADKAKKRSWNWYVCQDKSSEEDIAESNLTVANGTTPLGKKWSITIIAGNVAKEKDDPSDRFGKNAGSLVTLIQFGNQKVLICGDATVSTENYLLTKRSKDIEKLTILQAPHHGSALTSSTPAFVKQTNPGAVVVSVDLYEDKDHLPGKMAIDRYCDCTGDLKRNHPVDEWELVAGYKKGYENDVDKKLAKWKEDKVAYTQNNSNYIRNDADSVTNDYILLNPSNGYMLYRKQTPKSIYETGVNGREQYLTYILDGK